MNKKEDFEEIFKGDSEKSSSKIAFKLKDESEKNTEDNSGKSDKWQVLIVDDEESIHTVTRFALKNFVFQGKTIEFLDAYSAEEAKQLIEKNPNVAVVLLDVVMEEKDAGLKLIKLIREKLKNKHVRIVLRTGYPGEAPEREVIDSYSIDDYKVKTELTAEKLYSVVLASLRTYEIIHSLSARSELLRYIVDQKTKELVEYQNKLEDKISERTKELEETNKNLEDEIDKHKRTEASLKESEEKLRTFIDNSPIGIIITDMNGNIEYLNKVFINMFGYTHIDIPTLDHWWKLAYNNSVYRDEIKKSWDEIANKKTEDIEIKEPNQGVVTCKSGSVLDVEFFGKRIGERVLVIYNDISRRKQAEDELRKLKDELEMKVAEKTKELQDRIKELETLHEGFVNRELKMEELRKEIERLKKE